MVKTRKDVNLAMGDREVAMKNSCAKSGFTLIEMVIVIVILGILVGLALPRYSFTLERGRMAEGTQILGALRQAQLLYNDITAQWQIGSMLGLNPPLDVEIQTPRYFSSVNLADDPKTPRYVAWAKRNGVNNPGCGGYALYINEDGTISCDNDTSSCCSRFGLSAP